MFSKHYYQGHGLVGDIKQNDLQSEAKREEFLKQLSELMIKHHVDKIDVGWSYRRANEPLQAS